MWRNPISRGANAGPRTETLGEELHRRGFTRRHLLQFAALAASSLALSPTLAPTIAEALTKARRQSVIWLSFQDCTGCLESIVRSSRPAIEDVIFDFISLDYQETLMAASGAAAEKTLADAAAANDGKYLLAIDGSVPLGGNGSFSMTGGKSHLSLLRDYASHAQAVLALGTCAAYGGIPKAAPNPTGATGIRDVIGDRPVVNIPGCPPIPEVLTGVIVNFLTFGELPALDALGRPLAFYGTTVHDQCYRRPFYDQGKFAKSFDDDGARQGWCLFEVGCKGPVAHNACASLKWNGGTSYPVQSGHGCLGCSEPDFWDQPGGFYKSLSGGTGPGWAKAAAAAGIGVAAGAAAALAARRTRADIDRIVARKKAEQRRADEEAKP